MLLHIITLPSKKAKNINRFYYLIAVLLLLASCTNKNYNTYTYNADSIQTNKYSPPEIIFIDSCAPPADALIEKTAHNPTSLNPPEIKPASFYLTMPVYNNDNGLPLNAILCSFCDAKGNMWFGTDGGGVCRFDGKSFVTYSTSNGLANNHVWYITEDRHHNIWIASNGGGASCFDGKSFKTLNEGNGLISNYVKCILEDRAGHIWMATDKGITKLVAPYKGLNFANSISVCKKISMPFSDGVTSMAQSNDGNIWCGTIQGAVCIDANTNGAELKIKSTYTIANGLPNNYVTSLYNDSKGKLWLSTIAGLSMLAKSDHANLEDIDKNKFINYNKSNGLIDNNITSIAEDLEGNIWLTSNQGVSCFNQYKFKSYTTANGLLSNYIKNITCDKQGNLWFATYGLGACCYNGNTFEFGTTNEGLIDNNITCLNNYFNGSLWIGTNAGFSVFNDNDTTKPPMFTNYGTMQGLHGNLVRCIFQSKNDHVWITTIDSGLSVFEVNSLHANSKLKATYSKSGSITYNHQVMQSTALATFNINVGNSKLNLRTIFEDKAGNIWIACNNGLLFHSKANDTYPDYNEAINKLKMVCYTKAQGLPDNLIYSITEDHTGNLWFASQKNGVSKYDGNRVSAIKNGNTPDNTTGLKKINQKFAATFTNYNTKQGLGHNCVFKVRTDTCNNIWLATYGGGLSRYHPSEKGKLFLNFTTDNGLADNAVYDFVFDHSGNIVAGTNLGFSVLTHFFLKKQYKASSALPPNLPVINNLNNFDLEKYYQPVFEIFNKHTGYPIKDIVNGSMYCDSNGIVWAGSGDDKLIRFNRSAALKIKLPPQVAIQQIKINDENICWSCIDGNNLYNQTTQSNEQMLVYGKQLNTFQADSIKHTYKQISFDSVAPFYQIPYNLELDYKHNQITFDYTTIEPASASLAKYQYILEGYSNGWHAITNKTTATFGNMHEGTYTFKLKALDTQGQWSKPVSYTFKVLPPWYRSIGAYISYVILFASATWGFIRRRELKIKEKSDFEKRIAEVEMQALRSQMNPHFIFNSLHAINKYMLDNDKQNASAYLSRFSQLMRLILENSRQQEVPLEKDLSALELYMQLEQLRFQQKFTYAIEIDAMLNAETTLIPPMLLQPFVENSILHGFKDKQNGFIQITINKTENNLHCIVQDNGIGRLNSINANASNTKKHESLAMKITQERLHIIEQSKNIKTNLSLIDMNAAGSDTGLRVELILPFEEAF